MKNIRKALALVLALCMVVGMTACGNNADTPASNPPAENSQPAEPAGPETNTADAITLWTYPIGNWGVESEVQKMTDAFTAATGIKVTVEYLAYADGDDKVNAALSGGGAPDLIMEGPERLVANWGVNGHMVDYNNSIP